MVLCEKMHQVLQYLLSKYKQLLLEGVVPYLKGSCFIFSKYMLASCKKNWPSDLYLISSVTLKSFTKIPVLG